MTSLELLTAAFQFKKTPRLPLMMLGAWPQTLVRWKREGLPDNWAETNFFGLDGMSGTGVMLGTCFWSPFLPRFEKSVIENDGQYNVFWDPNGRLMKQHTGELDQSVAEYLEFPVKTRNDWDKLKWRMDPDFPGRYADLENAAQSYKKRGDCPVSQSLSGPYRLLWHVFGDAGLCYALYDDPEMIHDIMEHWLKLNCAAFDKVMKELPVNHVTIMEDMSCNTGMMISPAHFNEFLAPYYKSYISHIKKYNSVFGITVDTDGNVNELIPLLLDCGVNCVQPFEVQAGMDVVALRRIYGNRLVIRGGIDKRVLAKTKSDIDRELDRVLPTFVETGGYIISLDHQAPPDISLENYMYFLEKARTYSGTLK